MLERGVQISLGAWSYRLSPCIAKHGSRASRNLCNRICTARDGSLDKARHRTLPRCSQSDTGAGFNSSMLYCSQPGNGRRPLRTRAWMSRGFCIRQSLCDWYIARGRCDLHRSSMRYILGLLLGGRAEQRFPIPTLFDSRYSNKRALSALLFRDWTISHVALSYYYFAHNCLHTRANTIV
jgi:hypothetical protein